MLIHAEHACVHVVPRKVPLLFSLLTDCPDEPGLPLSLQREDDEKIAAVERDMQFTIHGGAARLHIGDVEEMVVDPARKTNLQGLTDNGMCAIAAGNVGSLTRLLLSIRGLQMGNDSTSGVLKGGELCPSLDLNAGLSQALNQQTLVLVLRKDQRVGERTEPNAHFSKNCTSSSLAGDPEIRGNGLPSTLHHRFGKANLAVELERPCLNSERARRGPWAPLFYR